MSLHEVRTVTGGILAGGDARFTSLSIDTRTLRPEDLFVAIKGPHFNGNAFIAAAKEKQACGAIVDESVDAEMPTLRVGDSRLALGKIGAMNRQLSTACVIALTGSQGKTTVKEMTAGILAECGEVIMTRGNLNNDLGVPLSLSRIERQHNYAVIELGASGPGEIAYTVDLVRPHIGHITNIAGTHLQGFGDLAGVARAKAEIWQGILDGGTAVVNLDDDFAGEFCNEITGRPGSRKLVTVSAAGNPEADYSVQNARLDHYRSADFTLRAPRGNIDVTLRAAGSHNVGNALAAAALSMEAGAALQQVKAGLEKFSPVPGRFCVIKGIANATIIDDTYNASPSSFRAAIDVLAISPGKKIVVMGDMGELGAEAETAHSEIGRYAREKGVDHFLAMGDLSRLAAESFGVNGLFLADRGRFRQTIIPLLNGEATVLIKGSRSQGMEKLVKQIQEAGS